MDLRERPDGASRHPWEISRSRFFRRLVRAHVPTPPSAVLDVGSGDSWLATQLLADLPSTAHIDCWDAHYTDADLVEQIDPRIHRTATSPTSQYPCVLALDVLEHVEHDTAFVADAIAPLVQPGGTLIASVPAHQWLFTRHDVALGHSRRHSRASLRALLSPHFTIVAEGSLFASLLLPRAAQKLAERVRRDHSPATDVESGWHHGPLLTRSVTAVLDADARLGAPLHLPGLSVWAVCRASDQS